MKTSNLLFATLRNQVRTDADPDTTADLSTVKEAIEATPAGPSEHETSHTEPVVASNRSDEIEPDAFDRRRSIYLQVDEVDQPAMPVGEWVINTQAWPPHTATRVIVKIWISAKGHIDDWELVGPSADDPFVLEGFKAIKETILNPAWLNGVPVASFRLLEIDIERD